MKKIVVFGGGHGMNYFLQGIKLFPVEITAVISVCDNGKSTGKLREEFNMPAVGDLRNVIVSLAKIDSSIKDVMQYRFNTYSDLNGHPIGNLLITGMYNMTGSLKESIDMCSKLLDVDARVLPLSEDYLTLMGETIDGEIVEGESNIPLSGKKYKKIIYKEKPKVLKEVLDAVKCADAIVFSMGSLYTSTIPHLLCKDLIDEISKSKAKIIYLCNAVTQFGETEDFSVSDHLKILNKYLKKRKVDTVLAANTKISDKILAKYSNEEQKGLVKIDKEEIARLDCKLILGDILTLEDDMIRHDSLKLATVFFSYLMRW